MSTNQESNLKRALRELQGKYHNWKSIGQALGVPPQDIAITESNHRDNGERCLEEVLRYWFRNYRDPSWEELSKALNTSEATRLTTSASTGVSGAQTTSFKEQAPQQDDPPPPYGHRLGPGDIDTLLPLLRGVAPNWREVARGLGFSHEEVDIILSDSRRQSQQDYLEDSLAQWLGWSPQNKHPYPLTEVLVRSLRLEEVGEYGVAEEVEKHFMSQDRTRGIAEDNIHQLKRQRLERGPGITRQQEEMAAVHKGNGGNTVLQDPVMGD